MVHTAALVLFSSYATIAYDQLLMTDIMTTNQPKSRNIKIQHVVKLIQCCIKNSYACKKLLFLTRHKPTAKI